MTPNVAIHPNRLRRTNWLSRFTLLAYRKPGGPGRGNLSTVDIALGVLSVLSLGAACNGRQVPTSDAIAPVEILSPTEPVTLDPRFATRALDVKLTRLQHRGLVRLSPDTLEPVLDLAKHIERDGALGLTIELQPNQRFHSGTMLRPQDVCATLEAVKDPLLLSPHRSIVASFVNCRVRGLQTITLDMAEPRASFLTDLELPILRADEAKTQERADGRLDGLGRFKVTSRTHEAVNLAPAFPGPGKKPRFSLVVRTIQDENVRAMRLLSGKAEIAHNAFSPTLLSGFRDRNITIHARPGATVSYLLANCDLPPFDKPEFRRAISLAVDRKLITQQLLGNYARPAKWLIPEGHWAAAPNLPELRYSRGQAATTLSGHSEVLLLTSTDRSRLLQARAIAQMLSDAGLPTRAVPLELGLLLSRLDAGQFALAILQIPEMTEPNILRWFFHPRGISTPSEGRNRARYRSPVAASLLDKASQEFDQNARKALYFELARVMLEDMPVIPLWHEDQVVVERDRGAGFLPSAEGRWGALAEL